MPTNLYQYIVPILAIVFIVRVTHQFYKRKRSGFSLFIWLLWWIVFLVVALVPEYASVKMAAILGFKDNVHAVIFVALGLLFLFTFYYSTSIERMQRQMSQMVRDQALQDAMRESEKEHYEELIKKALEEKDDEDTLRA